MVIESDVLDHLRMSDSDVAQIIDTYAEIETVFRGSLAAMGHMPEATNDFRNTSEITLRFHDASTARADTMIQADPRTH